MGYVRFQSSAANTGGKHPGVLGLVNGLSRTGTLTTEQEEFRRRNNAWYDAHLPDPASIDPAVYDRELNPLAAAWFRLSAQVFIDRVGGYLDVLRVHRVGWERLVWSQ